MLAKGFCGLVLLWWLSFLWKKMTSVKIKETPTEIPMAMIEHLVTKSLPILNINWSFYWSSSLIGVTRSWWGKSIELRPRRRWSTAKTNKYVRHKGQEEKKPGGWEKNGGEYDGAVVAVEGMVRVLVIPFVNTGSQRSYNDRSNHQNDDLTPGE